MSAVPQVALAPGYTISRLIKGGWQLAGGHGAIDREQAIADTIRFAEAGITTFDCADIYIGVEALLSDFLRAYRARAGAAAAAQIRIHTKFVPDLDALPTLGRADVERTIDRSLRRLGVEALDLVQFAWWDYDVPRYVEVGEHLAGLQRQGKIRHLGATNFSTAALRELIDGGVGLVSHQVQYSLLDRRPEATMVDFCRRHGIGLLCYGVVAGGFLSERYLGAPEPQPPYENRSLTKYKLIIDEFGGWALFQELLAVLATIGRRRGVGLGTVALRAVLDRPQVAAAIVGARHGGHLDATLAASALTLAEADLEAIDRVLRKAAGPSGEVYGLERVKGGRHATIMRYNLNAQARE